MTEQEFCQELRSELEKAAESDKQLVSFLEKIQPGKADFADSSAYWKNFSDLIGKVMSQNIQTPGNGLNEAAAWQLLKDSHADLYQILSAIQKTLDEKQNLHIEPLKAAFPAERARQAAHSLEDPTVSEEVLRRRAESAVASIANSFHDDYIQKNAQFRQKAGLTCHVSRIGASKCCAWCAEVAGRYEVGREPDGFWRRHDHCSCQMIYETQKTRQRLSGSGRAWKVDAEVRRRQAQKIQYKPTRFTPDQARELERQQLSRYRGLTIAGKTGKIESSTPLRISMQFFGNKNIEKMNDRQLKKSISTWTQRLKEHEEYIRNPYPHCPDWDTYDSRQQEGLKKHWRKEIQNFENDIQAATEELKKRGAET